MDGLNIRMEDVCLKSFISSSSWIDSSVWMTEKKCWGVFLKSKGFVEDDLKMEFVEFMFEYVVLNLSSVYLYWFVQKWI